MAFFCFMPFLNKLPPSRAVPTIKDDVENTTPNKIMSNLTTREKNALKRLSNNKKIKNADKGGAVVIQDTPKYIEEVHRQLNDKKFYT